MKKWSQPRSLVFFVILLLIVASLIMFYNSKKPSSTKVILSPMGLAHKAGLKPTCSDRIMNQDETDTDCGGTKCVRCSGAKRCKVVGDCESGMVCQGGLCLGDDLIVILSGRWNGPGPGAWLTKNQLIDLINSQKYISTAEANSLSSYLIAWDPDYQEFYAGQPRYDPAAMQRYNNYPNIAVAWLDKLKAIPKSDRELTDKQVTETVLRVLFAQNLGYYNLGHRIQTTGRFYSVNGLNFQGVNIKYIAAAMGSTSVSGIDFRGAVHFNQAMLNGINTYGNILPPISTCDDKLQNGDETGIDCGGSVCKPCLPSCKESWSCSAFGECSPDGLQKQTCTDENKCGTSINRPREVQSCIPPIEPDLGDDLIVILSGRWNGPGPGAWLTKNQLIDLINSQKYISTAEANSLSSYLIAWDPDYQEFYAGQPRYDPAAMQRYNNYPNIAVAWLDKLKAIPKSDRELTDKQVTETVLRVLFAQNLGYYNLGHRIQTTGRFYSVNGLNFQGVNIKYIAAAMGSTSVSGIDFRGAVHFNQAMLNGINTYGNILPPISTCDDKLQNGDETGIDCGGSVCKPCLPSCKESWSCSAFGECSPDGLQKQTCTDENKCGTSINRPREVQSCIQNKDALTLNLYPHHEDSTIVVTLNLANIQDFNKYNSLGFIVYKENGVEYHPKDPVFVEAGNIKGTLQRKSYNRIVTNLNSNSEYELCLTGMYKDYLSTGNFDCKKIITQNKKQENAIILINYDVEQNSIKLIDEWISFVKNKNSMIEIKKINIQKGTSPEKVLNLLKKEYDSSNLNYLVFIGYDLPVFETEGGGFDSTPIKRIGMYSSLSNIKRGEFINENNVDPANEVTISVIRPQSNKIADYFERLIKFYKGEIRYPNRILLADAMIGSEKSIIPSYFKKSGYSSLDIDLITGISDYSNLVESKRWKEEYFTKLSQNNYKFLILNAHGSRDIHYPCDPECVDYTFIDDANPSAQFIIGVSCNIGNVMTENSPMVSYVFNGNSISALATEVLFFEVNAMAPKSFFDKIVMEKKTIGEAGRRWGTIVIGDPFIVY